ncbi:RDD family protein [Haloarchaeobius baliensis]|uniref:RDD family protein n=1 Tax=Haloarchaeobius baliensis TaxID=1670458 RepID=UPI003F885C84
MQITADPAEAIPKRVLAFGVDWLVLSLVSVLVWFLFWLARPLLTAGGSGDQGSFATGWIILYILLVLARWAVIGAVSLTYFTLFQTRSGQTPGMKLLDITVVGEDGSSVSVRQALVRNVILLAPLPFMALINAFDTVVGFLIAFGMMVVWLFVELGAMFVLGNGQRLGDRAAGTVVVETAALASEDVSGRSGESTQPADA